MPREKDKDKDKEKSEIELLRKQLEDERDKKKKLEDDLKAKINALESEKESALQSAEEAKKDARKANSNAEAARRNTVGKTNKFRIRRLTAEDLLMVGEQKTFRIKNFFFFQKNSLNTKDETAAAEKENIHKVPDDVADILRKKPLWKR